MSRTTPKTKAQALAQLQALIAGLQKQLPNSSFKLVSTDFTTATLVTALQGTFAALSAVNTAQASVKAALAAWNTEVVKMGPIILALKRILRSMFANAPDVLILFGLEPQKAPAPRTGQQIAASAAKAEATRKARGTASRKQKAAIKGNVTGITIIPETAPVPAPAPSAQAAVATPTVPSGTAGK